eukprot:8331864-Pyramimonas_sp.AAC.1
MYCELCGESYALQAMWCKPCGVSCQLCGVGGHQAKPRQNHQSVGRPGGANGRAPGETSDYRPGAHQPGTSRKPGKPIQEAK